MKLRILKAEVLEAKDEVAEDEVTKVEMDKVVVDVREMMLKRAQIKPGNRIDMVVIKKGAKEIDPSHKWNASSVASTAITQESADRQVATIVVRSAI